MLKGKSKIWISILIVIAITVSFYAGGVIGFDKGFNASEYFRGTDSIYTVAILNSIREDRRDDAIKLLETKLDGQIFAVGFFEDDIKSIFWPASFVLGQNLGESTQGIMAKVAEYRKKYSSVSEDEKVSKVINDTLRKYSD